ncbi:hypothetical protein JK182_01840 [Acetobacter okinawensis]|uniref:hypothetical protein n=1 Tax=Acetobacter okinawensis TaxID=1076594 RepID=UPI001BA721C5|nr:hypothetical protein [Acetobacter okinawensis]MBS0987435.1 hypothetical protein [Acetobacter okinawensis]
MTSSPDLTALREQIRQEYVALCEQIQPGQNYIERIFFAGTLAPGDHALTVRFGGEDRTFTYECPEDSDEVALLVSDGDNRVAVRLDTALLSVQSWNIVDRLSGRDMGSVYELPLSALRATDTSPRQALSEFLSEIVVPGFEPTTDIGA